MYLNPNGTPVYTEKERRTMRMVRGNPSKRNLRILGQYQKWELDEALDTAIDLVIMVERGSHGYHTTS